jgi:hypothetical protein
MLHDLLISSLELLLEDWRYNLNKVYALQGLSGDPVEAAAHQREIDRRVKAIKTLETLITETKQLPRSNA